MRDLLKTVRGVLLIIYLVGTLFLSAIFAGLFLSLSYLGLWLVYLGAHRLGRWLLDVSAAAAAWTRDF